MQVTSNAEPPQDTVDALTTTTPAGTSLPPNLTLQNFPLLHAATIPAANVILQNLQQHASHSPPYTPATAEAHDTSLHASNSPLNNTASSTAHNSATSDSETGMVDDSNITNEGLTQTKNTEQKSNTDYNNGGDDA